MPADWRKIKLLLFWHLKFIIDSAQNLSL